MQGDELVGLAAIITALSLVLGQVLLFIISLRSNGKVLEKTEEIHVLSNNNFSTLQKTLDTALARLAEMETNAAVIAAALARSTELDAEERRERDRLNRSHLPSDTSNQ